MNKIGRNLIQIGVSALIFMSGYAIAKIRTKNKTVFAGNLRIDKSEPNEPAKMYIEFENEHDMSALESAQAAVFKVLKRNYSSQK